MTWLYLIPVLMFVGGVGLILGDGLWKRWRPPARQNGIEPGHGHVLMHSMFSGAGRMGGTSRSWHVPRDPQAYAKFFVPQGQNKD